MRAYALGLTPVPANRSCTSRRRHTLLFSRYSLSPVRYRRRATPISLHGTLRSPARLPSLSKTRLTSASPTAFLEAEPWKMTSSILCPRRVLGLCSPRAQRMASATFDLPHPFGPTMHVTPGKTWTSVFSANDLKPWMRMCSSRMACAATAHLLIPRGAVERQTKNPTRGGRRGQRVLNAGLDARSGALQETALLVLFS